MILWRLAIALGLLCVVAMPLRGQADDNHAPTGFVGIRLKANDGSAPAVRSIIPKSPADAAGIRVDDRITAVNGVTTQGMPAKKVLLAIDGDVGTTVKLTLQRAGADDRDVSLARRSFLEIYLPAANAGDPEAETELARARRSGAIAGVSRDPAEAIVWYRKAADQGYAPAQTSLGYLYQEGILLQRDPVQAVHWYTLSARQGNAAGEADLGFCYMYGVGIARSDRDAFDWFYSAALQDDAMAEYHLGTLYREGRGVPRDLPAAFAWEYRSAQRGDAYGKWELAYLYERGLGVKPDLRESLRLYQEAQAALPDNEILRRQVALLTIRNFLENRDTGALDLSPVLSAFRQMIWIPFIGLTLAYLIGGATLLGLTFRAAAAPVHIAVAIGWIVFYAESQAVTFLFLCLLGNKVGADILVGVTALFGALPLLVSSLGSARTRLWKASALPWKRLVLYAAGAFLALSVVGMVYEKVYVGIAHAPLPAQPSLALVGKTKDASAWLAYAVIALLMPAAEEILFRGYLFEGLRKYFSGWPTILISAGVFSLLHFQWVYVVPLFALGIILGWVRWKSESLRLPFLLHALNNALSLFLLH
jgi:TPR repeat protein/membrane protease YdiL (CAAX protease family)